MKKNKILNNTIMLMIFNIAKIIFPFITLPYLTRIFTTDTYGTVAYVKTVMSYMQIFVDFGFVLSATKDIVKARENEIEMSYVIGNTLIARVILGIIGFLIILVLSMFLPILRNNITYTLLSYISIFLSIFLMDYVFRGLEKMNIIAIRFILMKTFSTILTFIFIKNDANFLLIPVLDIISTLAAILLIFFEFKKLNVKMRFSNLSKSFNVLKGSFVYFLSNMASTSFNALSTIIIGFYLRSTEVAFWSVCIQIIGTIQACYGPIAEGIYPEMVRSKDLQLLKKVMLILTPIVIVGCISAYFLAKPGLLLLGGEKYLPAVHIFQILIPALFFGIYAILLGWPTLGVINKQNQVTYSTILSFVFNIIALILLVITNNFTLVNIAIVRVCTEFVLFIIRLFYFNKYKYEFYESKELERI